MSRSAPPLLPPLEERALHGDGGQRALRHHIVVDAAPLEVGFVDEVRVDKEGIAKLQRVLFADDAAGLRRQAERAHAHACLIGAVKGVADGCRIAAAELKVEARVDREISNGRGNGLVDARARILRVDGVNHRLVLPDDAKAAEEVGCVLRERPRDIADDGVLVIAGLVRDERVGGVDAGAGAAAGDAALEFFRAGLGDDFEASVTDAVELRREGILIDAHFAD